MARSYDPEGSGHTREGRKCGREESMEHGIAVGVIAGPSPCRDLGALRTLSAALGVRAAKAHTWAQVEYVCKGERMHRPTPVRWARLSPWGACRLWDIHGPVYHPIYPFQSPCQRLAEAVGFSLESQREDGSRKVDFRLLRRLHGPQASSAEGWRRTGKCSLPCHCGLQQQPLGRRKSP